MSTKRWIDLSAEGLYLGSIRMSDGVERLSLLDINDKADPARLRDIGFLPFAGNPRFERGIYYLGEGQGLAAQRLAAAVGVARAPIVEVKAAEIEAVFRAKCLEKFQANINAAALRCLHLGANANGHAVYQGPAGRFVRTGPSEVMTERGAEATKVPKALFLRADTDEDLRSCAQGFVGRVLSGEKLDWNDAAKFGAVVFGKGPTDGQMHRLQEAIEACAYSAFAQRAHAPDAQALRLATDFYFGLPAARMRTAESVYLQQYSTPLPMSVVAQRLLIGDDVIDGKSVLEPAGGNGGLLNLLPPEMKLFAVELDRKRAEVLAQNARLTARVGDATDFPFRTAFEQDGGFDYTIANPPFGALEEKRSFDKLPNVRRIDHFIALRALEARKPAGRSVVILGADSAQSKGVVEGGSRNLLNYLHDHYEVHGAVEVDGRLYSRQGSGYNVRLLVIGSRREQPIRADVPATLPILTTYDELWGWSEKVVGSYDMPRPETQKARKAEPEVGDSVYVRGGQYEGTIRTLLGHAQDGFGYVVSDAARDRIIVPGVEFHRSPAQPKVGERVKFTALDAGAPLSMGVVEGRVLDAASTSAGNTRYRILTDDVAPQGGGNIEKLVYSHQGRIVVIAPAPELAVAEVRVGVFENDPVGAPGGWLVMNASRPLLGSRVHENSDAWPGRMFYAAIDPADPMASRYIEENKRLDARVVLVASREEQVGMAVVRSEYRERYYEMEAQERTQSAAGLIRRLNEKTYGEAKALLEEARAYLTTLQAPEAQRGSLTADGTVARTGEVRAPGSLPDMAVVRDVAGKLFIVTYGRFDRVGGQPFTPGERPEMSHEVQVSFDLSESRRNPDMRAGPLFYTGLRYEGDWDNIARYQPTQVDQQVREAEAVPVARTGASTRRAKAETGTKPEPVEVDVATLGVEASPVFAAEANSASRVVASTDNGEKPEPWQMTSVEWSAALGEADASRSVVGGRFPGGQQAAAIGEIARLQFNVTRWYHERAKAGDKEALEWINLPTSITHREVIAKAISEKLPVPKHVLAEYQERTVPVVARRVNEYQAPYQPASKAGDASSMIPINMAGATYAALNRLEAEFGPIDDFVAAKLRYPVERMRELFSPEQVDALGLGIQAVDNGRGVINADQTGMGKGRYVAGMMRYAKLSGKVPVFLTIKPELFTDIFRDISDIDSQELFKRLFIFNDGVNVMKFGTEDEVLYRATSVQERRKALTDREIDPEVDMVLGTYSQFARAGHKNLKTQLLGAISQKDSMLFLDEAHVASGASNTSEAVGDAVANSAGVVYSSATPLKGVSNFAIYSKVFPASVDLVSLPETLKSGGEALQEAISANMARDGVLIRREHDFSKLTFVTRLPDEKRQAHNVALANQLAAILSGMSYLSGDVAKLVSSANKKYEKAWEEIPDAERRGTRMRASSMNFGSRLYALNRQFLLGIKVDDCVEAALESLQAGRKPVIALENTGEALLRTVIARRAGVAAFEEELQDLNEREGSLSDEERVRRDALRQSVAASIKAVRLDEPPQYRELLEIMLERIGEIKVQGRYGDVTTTRPESKEYKEAEARVRDLIHEFPDLHLAPLDVITHELESRGFGVAEVSGRTSSITKTSEGWAPEFHAKADAVANVAGFQSGKYDAGIITRSGSTGISLHATDRFADSDIRQREFIALQKAANIAEFLQWLGRVNRKDQVSSPIITNLESCLPAERRLTMMHNAKLRKLSANTTSNRENGSVEGDETDWLNEVGDSVALDWLCENPEVADELDITLPKDAEEEGMSRMSQEAPYVNKLMGRLMMVGVDRQLDVLRIMGLRFNDRIAELEQRGENPFKINVYEWGAAVLKQEELQSGVLTPTDSTFDEAVSIATLTYEQDVKPIRKDRVLAMVSAGLKDYAEAAPLDTEGRLDKFKAALRSTAAPTLRKLLPVKLRDSEQSVEAILATNDLPMVKKAREKQIFLLDNLDYFKPGSYVVHADLFKGEQRGVATAVDFPSSPDDAFLLSKYLLRVAFPGEERTKELSLATIFNEGGSLADQGHNVIEPARLERFGYLRDRVEKLLRPFDDAPDGRVTRRAHVLQGNLFRACELAHTEKLGAPILYSDANGNRQRAVLLKDRVTPDMVKALPLGFDAGDAMAYIREFLRPDHPQHRARAMFGALRMFDGAYKDMKKGEGVMLEVLQGGQEFRLTLPGTKLRAGALMTDGAIFDIGEKTPHWSLRLKLNGSRAFMAADVGMETMPQLLACLQHGRHVGKFYVPSPEQDVLKALKSHYEAAAQRQREQRSLRAGAEDTNSPEP